MSQTPFEIVGIPELRAISGGDLGVAWARFRKQYKAEALVKHPDKGGTAAEFAELQTAWDVVKGARDEGADWVTVGENPADGTQQRKSDGKSYYPSSTFFNTAACQDVPGYAVEHAKSSRSTCVRCKTSIPVCAVRCGSLDLLSGTYGRWSHVKCWRVPVAVHTGIPDNVPVNVAEVEAALKAMEEIVIVGVTSLDQAALGELIAHVANPYNHASLPSHVTHSSMVASAAAASVASAASTPPAASTNLVSSGPTASSNLASPGSTLLPVPGGPTCPAAQFSGQTFVLTGVFPALGGGTGLNLGKDAARRWIETHGGRVVSGVSKRTNFLVVGEAPGASKIQHAVDMGVCLTKLDHLGGALRTSSVALVQSSVDVKSLTFSAGYASNRAKMQRLR